MVNKIHAFHHPLVPNMQTPKQKDSNLFADVLKKQEKVELSKHATNRMQERNIVLSDEDWHNMNDKLDEAKVKGVKESLVIMSNAAFIVNAQNKKVITALDKTELQSQIFTNINGTIVLD
ncbi:TIGR02530 family flagellar biosynthesis protein [Gracilibacillus sp. S3-1-1]|uniref:TIGR02530 family flagellar biosynthesis protein n=1 Tax=Gracilibacillus pellucidus TaxID=3095368 RepID=A0ACC6M7X5_9BACI|nr:TIGR02530 family flagellar biosynthesis protein [Gracilibacillus sp. S3-1-1]MDX8046942.1 TIGR02530 family flagellar biosynthesis protein [Gracilibacillus sp. S3-1-1]